ncbi:hypothetical protein D9615_005440 [Tricholomella constricta]|uniref:HNH nuclease domain-containing protein n=1 Tax=Tricholomella constricta TaxID=117010 RepID=A0A8H5HEX8_9AGAR|nr:hypothetical protein D9615_005440 [Tricholomella constricta]
MAANVELWMPFDGHGVHQPVLSIPVNDCQRFSLKPLSWLRYLGFTIYGNEGHISTVPGGLEVDYNQDALLLDPDLLNDRTPDALSDLEDSESDVSITASRSNFKDRVAARDGSCLMTQVTRIFVACHIIPHAKGNQYLINLAEHRHEVLDPPLEDINDTRNGITLALQLEFTYNASEVAFLRTPNFAMTVHDVDFVAPRLAEKYGIVVIPPSVATRRLTFQDFGSSDCCTAMVAPHNSDGRIADSEEWPPPLLFDVAYGCVALKKWGDSRFVDFARGRTRDVYYENVVINGGNADHKKGERGGSRDDCGGGGGGGGGDGDDEKPGKKGGRHGQHASDAADPPAPDCFDMILAIHTLNARKGLRQAHAIKAEKTREKVRSWFCSC